VKGKPKVGESGLEMTLDMTGEIPIYVQIKNQLRFLIQSGRLAAGSQMPTVRSLAVDLGVNANTISRVYRELAAEGMITTRRGMGAYVPDVLPGEAGDLGSDVFKEIESLLELAVRNGVSVERIGAFLEGLIEKHRARE